MCFYLSIGRSAVLNKIIVKYLNGFLSNHLYVEDKLQY